MISNLVTKENIAALRAEALAFGDAEMARICDAALAGDDEAWECCAEAIVNARDGDDTEHSAMEAGA